MSNKQRSTEIFMQHIHLATTDGRLFRKTVLDQMIAEMGCSVASAATRYNDVFKAIRVTSPHLVEGLGRVKKTAAQVARNTPVDDEDDAELDRVYSVVEVIARGGKQVVGRTQCFIMQGDASECFDSRVGGWPGSEWYLIQGMGPMHGDTYRLRPRETEIKHWAPKSSAALMQKEYQFMVGDVTVQVIADSQSEARAIVESDNPGVDCWPVEPECA